MFQNLTKLNTLTLDYNPLRTLKPGTFKDLENLNTLLASFCKMKFLQVGSFTGLKSLQTLELESNELTELKRGFFSGLGQRDKAMTSIVLIYNYISYIEDGTFEELNTRSLSLRHNKLTSIPDLKGLNPNMEKLELWDNKISDLSPLSKSGIKTISILDLSENNISTIPIDTFKNINVVSTLDLSFNHIREIQPRLFQGSHLTDLVLQNNRIRKLDKDSFVGLPQLKNVFLFSNELQSLPDSLFANMELSVIFLSRNNFTKLEGRPFRGMNKSNTEVHLFSNDIQEIGRSFFDDVKGSSTITLDCQSLQITPHLPNSTQIFCTNYFSRQWITNLPKSVAKTLAKSGYACRENFKFNWRCIPCGLGTFSQSNLIGQYYNYGGRCVNCSAGGFYQDELAQIQCKKCNVGTFVHPKNAPATGPLMCQACPQGTQSSQWSGYRACKCLHNFHRFDRFGRCFPCTTEGWNCTNDYASLSEGYYWEWKNESMKKDYSNYIANLMIESRDYTSGTMVFTGSLPKPYKCPRKSCHGGLNSSCINGYHGPLCSLCDVGYYNKMNSCIRCPSKLWATIKVVIVIVLFILVLLAILWGDKRKLENEGGRTIADKILSCFKIVIGFYQVISGVYSASTHIEWPSSVIWMQKALRYIEFNVLEIAPLSCISPKLSFNALQQFVIVIGLNAGVVGVILVYLCVRILYLRRRKSNRSQRDIKETVLKAKSSCIRNICVFLFASYPKTCTSIIQVLPVNCLSLCFDSKHDHCSSYLRADFSIPCNTTSGYSNYSRAAMAFLFYPIGFPLVVLILVWKYASKGSNEDENGGRCNDDYIQPSAESPFKAGLRLFSENYKPNCWYWEVLEMIRKLVLVSGLTLIGEHSRTQVGIGSIVSAGFAVLYVYIRPIKNTFENFLQTISLMAVFLNLGIGTMLKSSDNSETIVNKHNDNVGVSVLLIIINIFVIGLVIGFVMKIIITKIIKCYRNPNHTSCFDRAKACLSCCQSLLLIEHTSRGSFTNDDREREKLINESRAV